MTLTTAELSSSKDIQYSSSSLKTATREVLTTSITAIKQEQESALVEFLEGKDVFAVLPTGFGKSLI